MSFTRAMIYVLTGNGKGKTTSALGMGLRAVGAGRRVLLVQFLKPGDSSEIKTIKLIKNFQTASFGKEGFIAKNSKPLEKDIQLAQQGLSFAEKAFKNKQYNFIILDEIFLALYFKLIKKSDLINLLKKYSKKIDLILTGRKAPKEVIAMSDLTTEFKEIKHYYNQGKLPRKGIEY